MRASGVIAYLTKPLDLTELGQLIDSFAAQHEQKAGPAPRTARAP
jgi:response regulator of citrate/malate metabolism